MDFMLRFETLLKVTCGSRKVGGRCKQLKETAVDISRSNGRS